MKIIESFICGKENNPVTCEDGLFISQHMVVVIDGVTAKGNRLWDGKKSGCFAKEVLVQRLQEMVDSCDLEWLAGERAAEQLIRLLDETLQECVKESVCFDMDFSAEEYPRASVIFYNDVRKEVVSYGDCQCRINDTTYSHAKKIDELNSDLRAYYLEHALLQGRTIEELKEDDIGRAAIQECLLMQFSFENKVGEFGYPVLNGMGMESSMMQVYKVNEGDEVILASDGYPELGASLEESEALLSQIMEEDPMCFRRYRSTKGLKEGNVSFDDRAFCKVKV